MKIYYLGIILHSKEVQFVLLNMHYALADCPYVANISDRLLHVVEDVTNVIACLGTIPDLFNNYVDFIVFI